jgi:hypothetical protein
MNGPTAMTPDTGPNILGSIKRAHCPGKGRKVIRRKNDCAPPIFVDHFRCDLAASRNGQNAVPSIPYPNLIEENDRLSVPGVVVLAPSTQVVNKTQVAGAIKCKRA